MACKEYIDFEIRKGSRKGEHVKIKCGKCVLCRIDRQKEWTQRMMWQWQSDSYRGHFVTLTYADQYLPSDNSLHYEDLQKFNKRLRKRLEKTGIKYKFYAAGEYGEEKLRPHWHICIFGNVPYYILMKCWTFGRIDVRPLNRSRMRYTLKYLEKQEYMQDEVFTAKFGNLKPPMHHMSNGIGAKWIENHLDKLEDGYLVYKGSNHHDKIVLVPRYYRNKYGLGTPAPQVPPELAKQIQEAKERGMNYIQAYNTVYGAYNMSVGKKNGMYDKYESFRRYKKKKGEELFWHAVDYLFFDERAS